jgi:hypothetical protein
MAMIKGLEKLYELVPVLFFQHNGKDYNTPTPDMTIEGLVYVFQYGYKQSAADGMAGDATKVLEKHQAAAKASGNVDADGKPVVDQAVVDAEVAQVQHDSLTERVAGIRAGTIRQKASGPRDPVRTLAIEWLKDALKASGQKMPADKDKVKELVDGVVDRNRVALEAELKRRAKQPKITITL